MPDAPTKRKYSLSEIARIIGVEEKHIHLFAHKGLIKPITAKESEAHFTDIDCARLKMISRADKLGYSSDNIFNLIGTSEEVLDSEDPLSACERYAMAKYKQIYDELGHCEPLEQINKQCDLKLVTGYIKHLKGIRSGDPHNLQEQDAEDQSASVSTSTAKGVAASMEDAGQQGQEPAPTADIRRYSVAKYWEYMKKVEDLQKEVAADTAQDTVEPQDMPPHSVDHSVEDDMTLVTELEKTAGDTSGTRGTTSFSHVQEREEPHQRPKVFDKQQSWSVWILTGIFLTLLSAVYFLISSHNNEAVRSTTSAERSDAPQADVPMSESQKSAEGGAKTSPDEMASIPADESSETPVPSVNLEVQDVSLKHDALHNIYQADFTIAKNDAADNRKPISGYAFVNLKFSDETAGRQSLLLPSGEMLTDKPAQVRKGARFTIKKFMQMRVNGISDLPPNDIVASQVLVYSPEGELLLEKAFSVAVQPFISSSGQRPPASEEISAAVTQPEKVAPVEPEPPPAIVPDTPPPATERPDSSIKEEVIAATRPDTRKPSPPTPSVSGGRRSQQTAENSGRSTKPPVRPRSAVKIRSTGNPEAARWEQKSYNAAVQGDFDQAIVNASKAIELDPGRVNPYVNRSWAYLEKNMLQAAIQDCDTALSIDPQNAFAYNNRGLAYQRKTRNSKAEADYRKACNLGLDLGCQNLDALTKESRIARLIDQSQEAFNTKDWDNVIRLTTDAIRLDPQNAVAFTNRSAAYAQKDFLNKALKDSNEAIKLNPDFPLAYNNRGYVLELLGNNRKAAADYLKSCSLGSDLGCKNFERLNRR